MLGEELLYTKILEVNLFAFAYRCFLKISLQLTGLSIHLYSKEKIKEILCQTADAMHRYNSQCNIYFAIFLRNKTQILLIDQAVSHHVVKALLKPVCKHDVVTWILV